MGQTKRVTCLACSGTGKSHCNACKGKGHVGGVFLGIGRRPCTICAGSGVMACLDCHGSGEDTSPNAGLRSDDLETRKETVVSLGLSDDLSAFVALRDFRDKGGALFEPVRDDVQEALRTIRKRAILNAPSIKEGMSWAELVNLLGPPISGERGTEILGRYGSASGSAKTMSTISLSGYYMFRHPAGDYGIVVSDGRVAKVYDFPYVNMVDHA